MKIFGFYISRSKPEPEVVVEKVEVPVAGKAIIEMGWVVDIELSPPRTSFGRFCATKEYFSSCCEANKVHPGKYGRQVEIINIGGRRFLAGELREVTDKARWTEPV